MSIPETRIIEGVPANPQQYPFFAWLYIGFSACGGSLIEPDVIMTAAHCLTSSNVRIYIQVNFTDKYDDSQTYYRQSDLSVSHPNYDPSNLCSQNDIALIFMNSPVYDVPVVRRNRKSSLPNPKSRTNVTTIGFGLTDLSNEIFPDKLMEASIQTLPNDVCKKQIGSCSVQASDICTNDDKKGVCFGDSGGPLMLLSNTTNNSTTKEMIQIGIVSRSKTVDPICVKSDIPQIFTRVSSYTAWIDKMICRYSKHTSTTKCPTLKPTTKRPSKRPTPKKKTMKPSIQPIL